MQINSSWTKSGKLLTTLAAAMTLAAGAAWAQIERLDLPQMLSKADNCVVGRIIGSEVTRVDHPTDGPQLYFTHLLIEGRSLYDDAVITVPVTFAGGFIAPGNGVWNSEAPKADDVRVGNEVVAFYKWTDNMGGDVAANALYAAHGGLYRVVKGRKDKVVLGQGDGYAISNNIALGELAASIKTLRR